MSENPCQKEFEEMLAALKEWVQADSAMLRLPIGTKSLSEIEDVEPISLVLDFLPAIRKSKQLVAAALERYQQKDQIYLDCMKRHRM